MQQAANGIKGVLQEYKKLARDVTMDLKKYVSVEDMKLITKIRDMHLSVLSLEEFYLLEIAKPKQHFPGLLHFIYHNREATLDQKAMAISYCLYRSNKNV